jgi:hypothetical protein
MRQIVDDFTLHDALTMMPKMKVTQSAFVKDFIRSAALNWTAQGNVASYWYTLST